MNKPNKQIFRNRKLMMAVDFLYAASDADNCHWSEDGMTYNIPDGVEFPLGFWDNVKEQYENKGYNCLCFGSPVFSKAWGELETLNMIKAFACLFLYEQGLDPSEFVRLSGLFRGHGREIRLQFLDWIIAAFDDERIVISQSLVTQINFSQIKHPE